MAGSDEGFVACQRSGSDVVQGEEAWHAKRLVVVEPAAVVLTPAKFGLQPDLGNGNIPTEKPVLDLHQFPVFHHDPTALPAAYFAFFNAGIGDGVKTKHSRFFRRNPMDELEFCWKRSLFWLVEMPLRG